MSGKVTKKSVNYRHANSTGRRCLTCSMFRPAVWPLASEVGSCTLVQGLIKRNDVCDRWERK